LKRSEARFPLELAGESRKILDLPTVHCGSNYFAALTERGARGRG
jgi:hypothetical protein